LWNFDDGTNATQTNVNHTYTAANTYDVSLVATSAQGCVDSIHKSVIVSQPVAVDFIADSVCLGEAIQFANTSTSGSSSVQYTWNFGDGGTSVLNSPTYTYAAKGVYSVILQASLAGGGTSCQSSKTLNVEIYERPTANFTFTDKCLSDTVSFVNQTVYTGGLANLTYNWNLNDGNLSTTQDVDHKYNIPGLYNVTMDVETIYGCTSSVTKQVEIYEMPNANFTVSNVCLNQPSEFTNTSTIALGNMTYNWDFDNGSTETITSPIETYVLDGSYQVELIATSDNGCLDTIVKTHVIYPKPLARFFYDEVCDGYQTPFYDSSLINSGTINSFSWDFGDGSSASGTTPTHQYLNVGNYSVNLAVVSDKLCTHDTTRIVVVNPNPIANFSVEDACIGDAVGFTNSSYVASGTISVLWDFGDGAASNQFSPTNVYSNIGLYDVKLLVTTGKGCVDSIVKIAEVFAPPVFNLGVDQTISLGDEIELSGFYSGALAYSWSPGEGLDNSSLSNPTASPAVPTTYVLTVTDGNGCIGQDSISIDIIEDFNLIVSNLITPDGNGVNDVWVVGNIENYGNATIYIYDRWGVEVLKTNNYQNDWAGVSGTDQLPDGTYYYIISLPGQEKVYKGGITVLRNK
jgi:gliding motility-associated-like protein